MQCKSPMQSSPALKRKSSMQGIFQCDAAVQNDPPLHAAEGEAAARPNIESRVRPTLAALLTQHVLSDGELVLLILKPSYWFITLSSLRFNAIVLTLMLAASIYEEKLPYSSWLYFELGLFVIAGRVMWAILQWMSRVYILTDLRIVRLAGVFTPDIFACPLRRVARARLIVTLKERPLGVGTIEIIPSDDSLPIGQWQTVSSADEVHRTILQSIGRARQNGCGG